MLTNNFGFKGKKIDYFVPTDVEEIFSWHEAESSRLILENQSATRWDSKNLINGAPKSFVRGTFPGSPIAPQFVGDKIVFAENTGLCLEESFNFPALHLFAVANFKLSATSGGNPVGGRFFSISNAAANVYTADTDSTNAIALLAKHESQNALATFGDSNYIAAVPPYWQLFSADSGKILLTLALVPNAPQNKTFFDFAIDGAFPSRKSHFSLFSLIANRFALGTNWRDDQAGRRSGHFDLYSLILCRDFLLDSPRQKIEGFLAWRHNLSLAPEHPWHNKRPTNN